jgi:hypothetical protein
VAQFRCEVAGSNGWSLAVVTAPAAGANAAAQAAVPVNTVATVKALLIDSSSRGRAADGVTLAQARDNRVITA